MKIDRNTIKRQCDKDKTILHYLSFVLYNKFNMISNKNDIIVDLNFYY